VNGVINIITKTAAATKGAYLDAGGGNYMSGGTALFGDKLDDNISYRAYIKDDFHNGFDTAAGDDAHHAYWKTQGGFRVDWMDGGDKVNVQGDLYKAWEHQPASPSLIVNGGNLETRWQRQLADAGTLQVLGYYDNSQRIMPGGGGFVLNTYDLEFQ